MYKLFYYPNNASLAPHFLLQEMELDFELVLVDRASNSQKTDEYLKLNPSGRIPTLIDGDLVLFESPAICIHLCEKHPSKGLIPPYGSPERAIFFQWITYLNNTLQAELMVYHYPAMHTIEEKCIPSIVSAQEQRIAESLAILDSRLSDTEYLLGKAISACDFFFFMLAEWSLNIERSPLSFENLRGYLKRLSYHPTIVHVCKKEKIDLSVFK